MKIKIEENPLEFTLPGSDTSYTHPDPMEFMLSLEREGLIDASGNATPETTEKLRKRVQEGFGFPSLTFPQLLQVLAGISDYVADVQKKTSRMPTSQPPTASSPKK